MAAESFTPLDVPLKAGAVEELPPGFCRKWFGDTGRYVRLGVRGKGSCFYYSLCVILNTLNFLLKSSAEQFQIAQWVRCGFQGAMSREDFERLALGTDSDKSYEQADSDFCAMDKWADELTILFVKEQLGLNLIFLDAKNETAFCGVHSETALQGAFAGSAGGVGAAVGTGGVDTQARQRRMPTTSASSHANLTGIILWTNKHRHFEPIGRIESIDDERGTVRIRTAFQPDCRTNDGTAVRHLMRRYAFTCDLVPEAAASVAGPVSRSAGR